MTATDGAFGPNGTPGQLSGDGRLPARIITVGLIIGLVIGGLLGALIGAGHSRSYQATTIASVLPDDALTTAATVAGTTSTEDSSDFIQGELVVITSQGLRETVQQRLKLTGLPSVSASQSGTTDVVDITATAATPALAQQVANTTRTVYAQQRAQQLSSDVATATTQVENQIAAVRKQVAATPGAAENSNSPLEQEYARLLAVDSDLALDSAQSASAVTTIQTAVVGGSGLSDTATYGLGGAVLGILIAAAGLVLVRRLRPRVYDVRDLASLGANVLTPVLPAEPTKAARAARVLASGMRGGSSGARGAVVLVGTDGGSDAQRTVAAIAVAFHDASPVLVLARPGTAQSLLTSLPAGTQHLSAADLQGKRTVAARLARLSGDAAPVRLAVVDAEAAEFTALIAADVLATASDAGWAVLADAPPLGESRLAVVYADRAGSATVLVAKGGADPSDVEATIAALRGAGVTRLDVLLHEQAPAWRRASSRSAVKHAASSGAASSAPETGDRGSHAEAPSGTTTPASVDLPLQGGRSSAVGAVPTGSAHEPAATSGAPTADAISNVRPVRALTPAKAARPAPVNPAADPAPAMQKTTEVAKTSRGTKRLRGGSA